LLCETRKRNEREKIEPGLHGPLLIECRTHLIKTGTQESVLKASVSELSVFINCAREVDREE
jgi:hypothetical protein